MRQIFIDKNKVFNMKYFKMFENQAAEDAWKESEDYIQPSITSDRENIDTSWNYKEKFRAHFDLSGLEGDVKLTNCGNIFDSLKINGEEKVSEKVEVTRGESIVGGIGEGIFDISYTTTLEDYLNFDKYIPCTTFFDDTCTLQFIGEGKPLYISFFSQALSGVMETIALESWTDYIVCVDDANNIYKFTELFQQESGFLTFVVPQKPVFVCLSNDNSSLTKVDVKIIKPHKVNKVTTYNKNNFFVNGNYLMCNNEEHFQGSFGKIYLTYESSKEVTDVGIVQIGSGNTCNENTSSYNLVHVSGTTYELGYDFMMAAYLLVNKFSWVLYDREVCVDGNDEDSLLNAILPTTVEAVKHSYEQLNHVIFSSVTDFNDINFSSAYDNDIINSLCITGKRVGSDLISLIIETQSGITQVGDVFIVNDDFKNNVLKPFFDEGYEMECFLGIMGLFDGEGVQNLTEEEAMSMKLDLDLYFGDSFYVTQFLTPTLIQHETIMGGAPKELSVDASVGKVTMLGEISPYFGYIPSEGFKETPITDVIIPSPISGINNGAFAECEKMNSAYLPKTIKKLGNETFCNSIHESTCVNVDRVEDMGKNVFEKPKNNFIKTIYTITETRETSILSKLNLSPYDVFDLNQLERITVDGVDIPIDYTYNFPSTKQYEVIYYLKKGELNLSNMLCQSSACTSVEIDLSLSQITNMGLMLTHPYIGHGGGANLVVNIVNIDTSKCTDMSYLFLGCAAINGLEKVDTRRVMNMEYMFYSYSGLTSLDLSNFDTSNVNNMREMFSYCIGLTSLDVSNFNTSNVTNMSYMFGHCSGLTSLDLSNFDTSKVTDMDYMFYGCGSLTSLDLSNFNTSNVIDMGDMFHSCSGLTSLDLSNFDTSKVTNTYRMFSDCYSLTSITFGSQADVGKVTSCLQMFYNITTTGTLYYPSAYADSWNNLLVTQQSSTYFPSTWTAVAV